MTVSDRLGRPLRNLRLSVTDRCNLRCAYCMPEAEYVWLPRDSLLGFEEISRLLDVFTRIGVNRVRLTGGEPLLRRDLPSLIRMLAGKPALTDIALTTNGVLLAEQAAALKESGLHRVTISLDTLDADRFRTLTRFDALPQVLDGIAECATVFGELKIDAVILRGVNDDELVRLLEFGRTVHGEVRFIEYMDVGGATRWSMDKVVSRAEMLQRLEAHYGIITPISEETSAPADRFALPDGTIFGIISSTTEPFCASCDRSRLTADGVWYLCLYATEGMDLRCRHPGRRLRRRTPRLDLEPLAGANGSRRRRSTRDSTPDAAHPGEHAAQGPTPRDAHARRIARRLTGLTPGTTTSPASARARLLCGGGCSGAPTIEGRGELAGDAHRVAVLYLMAFENVQQLAVTKQPHRRRRWSITGKIRSSPVGGFDIGAGENSTQAIRPDTVTKRERQPWSRLPRRASADRVHDDQRHAVRLVNEPIDGFGRSQLFDAECGQLFTHRGDQEFRIRHQGLQATGFG